jgi:hypothetical protein
MFGKILTDMVISLNRMPSVNKKRLIKAQQMTQTTITPAQRLSAHNYFVDIATKIEQDYFQSTKLKLRYEDLFPTAVEQGIEQATGIKDLKGLVNLPELERQINLVLQQRRIIHDAVNKYLTQAYDQWANQPY